MKRKILLGFGVLLTFACSTTMRLKGTPELKLTDGEKIKKPRWSMVFSDDFNKGDQFDSLKWSYCPRRPAAWSRYLTSSARHAFQHKGKLLLRMDDAVMAGDNVPYHSGGIQTSGKFSIRYGRIAVKARFKSGQGSWPAIWMMPEQPNAYGSWPNSGEIDIMEHINNEQKVHQTIHNGLVTNKNGISTATHQTRYKADEYNIYEIVWSNISIDFYVNRVFQYRYSNDEKGGTAGWPFDQPFYIILNQAGAAGWPGPARDEDMPFEMQVDWVRVYCLK